jgi:hypothetical protein
LAKQDEDTTEMNKAEEGAGMALGADDEAAEGAEPGEEPLDRPAVPLTPERAAVLRRGRGAVAAMRGDQVDALGSEDCDERV